MPVRFRVTIHPSRAPVAAKASADSEAVLCVCGGTPSLGAWDPKRSPKLACVERAAGGVTIWEGVLNDNVASPGTEFKFCVLNLGKHEYAWEQSCPPHSMPAPSAEVAEREFESSDPLGSGGYVTASTSQRASDDVVKQNLKVKLDGKKFELITSVAVCGDCEELGRWRPDRATRMKKIRGGESQIWEVVVTAKRGSPFKYIAAKSQRNVLWEERNNRTFGEGPSCEDAAPHVFGAAEPFEDDFVSIHASLEEPGKGASTVDLELDLGTSVFDQWIPWESGCCGRGRSPRTIYHAFNMSFTEVRRRLKEIHDLGFDAIQLSPAQKSKTGKEWWARYQPLDYSKIEGLGSLQELRQLGETARHVGIMLIGDVVFNHMIVVASGHEWQQAQTNPSQLKALQQRLANAVAPTFGIEDFQWPWLKMSGPHWDNENRYEGWGNGEWSELRYCPRVVEVHQQHLRTLLDAGVGGFRFDAVKHMRPAHVAEYVEFLRKAKSDIFVYGEVLSVDATMHQEYMQFLQMASTDFALTVYMNNALRSGADVAAAGVVSAAAAAASTEGVSVSTGPAQATSSPLLSSDSIRFARNHDTVMNPGSFYGLKARCNDAKPVWVWLLAVHDGTVLMYPDDIAHRDSAPLIQKTLKFRKRMGCASRSEVCLRYSSKSEPPKLLSITLWNASGTIEGICLMNLMSSANLRLNQIPLSSERMSTIAVLTKDDDSILHTQENGSITDSSGEKKSIILAPLDAAFFLAGDDLGAASW